MGLEFPDFQTTLRESAELSGVGIHSGRASRVILSPAEADSGISFWVAGSVEGAECRIPASWDSVSCDRLCTTLGSACGAEARTVEHLMSALYALGVDNAVIRLEGPEVPGMDGSALAHVEAILRAGLVSLPAMRRHLRVLKRVRVESEGGWAELFPHEGTRFEVEIDFDSPAIGRQSVKCELSAERFIRDLSRARTFGFLKDAGRLRRSGLALGSSLENSVAIDDDHRVANPGGLRYPDEFVRHKALDAIGDLALCGARLIGGYRSFRAGHKLNIDALRSLFLDPEAHEFIQPPLPVSRAKSPSARLGVGARAPQPQMALRAAE